MTKNYAVIEVKEKDLFVIYDMTNKGRCCCSKYTLGQLLEMNCQIYGVTKENKKIMVTEVNTDGTVRMKKAPNLCANLTKHSFSTILKGLKPSKAERAKAKETAQKRAETKKVKDNEMENKVKALAPETPEQLFFTILSKSVQKDTDIGFEKGVLLGMLRNQISAESWLNLYNFLSQEYIGKFAYLCDSLDAKQQLQNVFKNGTMEQGNGNKWGAGELSPEKQALRGKCEFISLEDGHKIKGWQPYWYNNPKFKWEWHGTDKYGRTPYDFNYMISRGITMEEFYGGGVVD